MSTPFKLGLCLLIGLFLLTVVAPSSAQAQVPSIISYQGVLSDNGGQPVADGSYSLSFALYDLEQGGQPLWMETLDVDLAGGVFSVQLGVGTPFGLPFDAPYWLGIAVENDPEMEPRLPLSSVPYSLQSRSVSGESNVFPSSGNVGIGTEGAGKDGTPAAKLDVEGNVRIADVPLDPAATKILTHGDDQIVKYTPIDVLAGLGLVGPPGPPGPAGPRGPAGPGGGVLNNIALIIINAAGDTTTVINPDGTSLHKGKETFAGGIELPNDQYIDFRDPSTGHIWTSLGHDGLASWLDQAMTKYINVGVNGISIYDETAGKYLYQLNADGTSYHAGLETFAGGIELPNDQYINFRDPSSNAIWTSYGHDGLASWLDQEMTKYINVGVNGISIYDETAGKYLYQLNADGTSYHAGLETFAGGIELPNDQYINFRDPSSNAIWTSYGHDGLASWLDQEMTKYINVGVNGIAIYDQAAEKFLYQLNADGTSFHGGLEVFAGGVVVHDSEGFAVTDTGNQPVLVVNPDADPITGQTLEVNGNSLVNGNSTVNGAFQANVKNFAIDHPLDPDHKILRHASVESSEMKTIYDGVVVLDGEGEGRVEMPKWFDALNSEYRYQLTAIGASAPGLFIAEEVDGGTFKIAGGLPGLKVSWQVTGIRQDKWALENPMIVESEKVK